MLRKKLKDEILLADRRGAAMKANIQPVYNYCVITALEPCLVTLGLMVSDGAYLVLFITIFFYSSDLRHG